MTFQVNWRCWHWPWHRKEWNSIECGATIYYYYDHCAGIGPFQWHWYSSK